MNRTTRLRLAALPAALLLGIMVPPTPASADPPGYEVVQEQSDDDSLPAKSVTALCPAGKVATGGAALASPINSVGGLVGLDRLEPTANGFIGGQREVPPGTAANWRLLVRTVCVDKPAGWQAPISGTSALDSNASKSASVGCGGKSLIGFGGRINNGAGRAVLTGIVPSNDLKTVRVTGHEVQAGHPGNWSVTAFAVCADPDPGLSRIGVVQPALAATPQHDIKTCPAGSALLSVGASVTGSGQTLLSGTNITTTDTARLRADEDADGFGMAWSATVYGICDS
jgi:hypothetical protein